MTAPPSVHMYNSIPRYFQNNYVNVEKRMKKDTYSFINMNHLDGW